MAKCKIPKGTIVNLRGYNAAGCPVRQPASELIPAVGNETPLVVTDSTTVDFTNSGPSGHTLTADVKISPNVGNQIVAIANGLFVPAPTFSLIVSTGNSPTNFAQEVTVNNGDRLHLYSTQTIEAIVTAGSALVAFEVRKSTDANNALILGSDGGLFVPTASAGVQTPITPSDSSTVDLTVSGLDNHTLQADVRLSTSAGNQIVANADGLFVPTAAVGAQTPITVSDSSSIDLTANGVDNHTLQADVKISATAGNVIAVNADGLFVPAAAAGVQTPITATSTASVLLTASGVDNHTLQANVQLSTMAGNIITTQLDGLFAPTETSLSASSSNTIQFSLSGVANHTINAGVKISANAGNAIVANLDGLYVPNANISETPISVTDSSTIDFTASGVNNHDITGSVKLSTTAGNQIVANADGLFVPAAAVGAQTPITVTDSDTVDLTASGTDNHTLQADVIIDPNCYDDFHKITKDPGFGLTVIRRNSNVYEVCNKAGWEQVVRNAPVKAVIKLDQGVYDFTETTPFELKVGQIVTGHSKGTTSIQMPNLPVQIGLFRTTYPINASTYSGIRLRNLSVLGRANFTSPENGGNASVGYEDTGGTDIRLDDVSFSGFDLGVILNQTELFWAVGCQFGGASWANAWIVNGGHRVAGADPGYSNVIRFVDSYFTGGDFLTNCLVVDDGGYGHWYRGCIFNGGKQQFNLINIHGWSASDCYWEGATERVAVLGRRTGSVFGTLVGRAQGGSVTGNVISAGALLEPIFFLFTGNGLNVNGNSILGNSNAYVFNSTTDFGGIHAHGNLQQMPTWQNNIPNPNSTSYNEYTYQDGLLVTHHEPYLIGMDYPGYPVTDKAVQYWHNGVLRKSLQNDGTIV